MQRVLVLISILCLVSAALAIGALAAHWPFWTRAIAWQSARGAPDSSQGSWRELRAASTPLPLQLRSDPDLAAVATPVGTQVLLVARGTSVRSHVAAGFSVRSVIDGRGLAASLLPLLIGVLQQDGRAGLLDEQIGPVIPEWMSDPRGDITVRQLFWQQSGLAGGAFQPLNPFSAQAALASGPDFRRAALAIPQSWPAGSHHEPAPVNSQLLAIVAGELADQPWADLLESRVWSRFAAHPARGMLDHRRGEMAAHCCLEAAAEDWLRVALVLAGAGDAHSPTLPAEIQADLPRESPIHPGFGLGVRVLQVEGSALLIMQADGRLLAFSPATQEAVFWSGSGRPDDIWLAQLFAQASLTGQRNPP